MTRTWDLQPLGQRGALQVLLAEGLQEDMVVKGLWAFPGSQSRRRFLESSLKANVRELRWEVCALGKAPSTQLLNCPVALTFHISWATGKVSISFSPGERLGKKTLGWEDFLRLRST